MANGDLILTAREPDCVVAPGDSVELIRLPGIWWTVISVSKWAYADGSTRYLLGLANHECGCVYVWHDDREEKLWTMNEVAPWDEPRSSAIGDDEPCDN